MEEPLKKRLIGAAVLASLVVIFVPMLLDEGAVGERGAPSTEMPPKPESEFASRLLAPQPVPVNAATGKAAEPEMVDRSEPPAELSLAQNALAREPLKTTPLKIQPAPQERPLAKAVEKPLPKPRTGLSAWVVQVGSFSSRANAQRLVDRLRKAGFDTFLEQADVTGKSVFRVRVGPEVDRARADKSRDRIARDFKLQGKVVRYP